MGRIALFVATWLMAAPACAGERAVVDALAERSRIPAEELRVLLADCEKTQRSMNVCAFRDHVAADLEMMAALRKAASLLDDPQRQALTAAQDAWAIETRSRCEAEADGAAEGGSMRPMVFSHCMEQETRRRTAGLAR